MQRPFDWYVLTRSSEDSPVFCEEHRSRAKEWEEKKRTANSRVRMLRYEEWVRERETDKGEEEESII